MKEFILETGRCLLDIAAFIIFLLIIVISIICMVNYDFGTGFGIFLVATIIFIISFYSLYLLVGIYDNLEQINQKLDK